MKSHVKLFFFIFTIFQSNTINGTDSLEEFLGKLKTKRFKTTISKLFKNDGDAIIQTAQLKSLEALNNKLKPRQIKIPIPGKSGKAKGNIFILSQNSYPSFYILNFDNKMSMRPMPPTFVQYFSAANSPSISTTLSDLFAPNEDKFLGKIEEETQKATAKGILPKNISTCVDNWILNGSKNHFIYLEYLDEEKNDLLANNHIPLLVIINQAKPNISHNIDEDATLADFSRAISDRSYAILVSPGVIYDYLERGYNLFSNIWSLYEHEDTQLILMIPRNFPNQHFHTTKPIKPLTINPELASYLKNKQEHASPVSEKDFAVMLAARQTDAPETPTYWNVRLDGHGYKGVDIVNLSQDSLHRVLNFFNNNVNTSTLMISSCFAGGENLNFIEFESTFNNTYLAKSLNYILLIQSISDNVVPVSSNDLYDYFFYTAQLNKSKGKDLAKLLEICGHGEKSPTRSLHGSLLLTQVRFPGTHGFYTFDIKGKVKVIGNIFLRIQEEERYGKIKEALFKKLQDIKAKNESGLPDAQLFKRALKQIHKAAPITIDNVSIVLIYPAVIPITLEIFPDEQTKPEFNLLEKRSKQWKLVPSASELFFMIKDHDLFKNQDIAAQYPYSTLVSQAGINAWDSYIFPEFISMIRGNAKHLIHRIDVEQKKFRQAGILNFIRDAFWDIGERESEKTFLIDEIHGYNDISVICELMRLLQEGNETNWDQKNLSKKSSTKTYFEQEFKKNIHDDNITIEEVIIHTQKAEGSVSFFFNKNAWEFSFNTQEPLSKLWDFKPKNQITHHTQYQTLASEIRKFDSNKQEQLIEGTGKGETTKKPPQPAAYSKPQIYEGPVEIVINDAINNILREDNVQKYQQRLQVLVADIEKSPSIAATAERFSKIIIIKSSPQKLQKIEAALIELSHEKPELLQTLRLIHKKINDSGKIPTKQSEIIDAINEAVYTETPFEKISDQLKEYLLRLEKLFTLSDIADKTSIVNLLAQDLRPSKYLTTSTEQKNNINKFIQLVGTNFRKQNQNWLLALMIALILEPKIAPLITAQTKDSLNLTESLELIEKKPIPEDRFFLTHYLRYLSEKDPTSPQIARVNKLLSELKSE